MYPPEECEKAQNSNVCLQGGKLFQDSSLALRHCVVSLLSWQPSCPQCAAVCPAVLGCVCVCFYRPMFALV